VNRRVLICLVMQTCVRRIRLDMPVTDADFVSQTTDDIDETTTVNVSFYTYMLKVLVVLFIAVASMTATCNDRCMV